MSPLTECVVLIPKEKVKTSPEAFCRFVTSATAAFGGYTCDGEVRGSWLDRKAGIVHEDISLTILILIDDEPQALSKLKKLVAMAAYELGEQAIFMTAGNSTHFVWAA